MTPAQCLTRTPNNRLMKRRERAVVLNPWSALLQLLHSLPLSLPATSKIEGV